MREKHEVQKIMFSNGHMKIEIDGKTYNVDIKKVSHRLLCASKKERETYKVSPSGYGIHWPLIDEDLSIDALQGIKHIPRFNKPKVFYPEKRGIIPRCSGI